ncbi:MAG TPA: cysteine desulfurase family protein [Acidimicrobiia bacterium]|jgi:cysteine desulfurase
MDSSRGGVYLDHAATTPLRPGVVSAMLPFLTEHFGNPSGAHAVARAAKNALEEAREQVADVVGARPDEIVFTSGGTEADGLAVKGVARGARDASLGDGVVVSAFEHPAVLASADRLEVDGFRVTRVPVRREGIVDVDALADALDERTAVVSVMTVNNEIGTVQPLADVAIAVRERAPNARFHTDAVQGAPWLDLARMAAVADLVSISAHKIGGPKGSGALVVRGGARVRPEADGGGQERGLRSGTVDVAAAVGLATALGLAAAERDDENIRIRALRDRLERGLLERCPGSWSNGDPSWKVPGNVNVGFPGLDVQTLLVLLDGEGIAASAGSSCASGAIDPSPVLLAMGYDRHAARSSLRLTLGWSSSNADVERALQVIPEAVERVRAVGASR